MSNDAEVRRVMAIANSAVVEAVQGLTNEGCAVIIVVMQDNHLQISSNQPADIIRVVVNELHEQLAANADYKGEKRSGQTGELQ